MNKKIRPMGQIQLELEQLYQECIEDHDVQLGDILYNAYGWAHIHNMGLEEYEVDGSNPVFLYGHKDVVKKKAKKL